MPIVHCQLPIAHCPLPIQLPIGYCPLPIVNGGVWRWGALLCLLSACTLCFCLARFCGFLG
ncbi:MAG TPA: hypothetical protein ENH80_03890 [Phycisphaerae bacterium]|nr:hypothetical protein [Phycisphaerae bacterium]